MNKWNKLRKQNLGAIPQEASANLNAPELAPSRSNKINIRTKPLNFKVSEEFYWQLKDLALKEKSLMVEIVEKSLVFYQQYGSEVSPNQPTKKLSDYVKIIESKPKKIFSHPHKDFTCDKCGGRFQDETAYSYASNLGKSAKTYCGDCVRSIN